MNSHVPFDACQPWGNTYGSNCSNDPLVDKLIGNAYHVVRTVYCNLGNLKLIFDFLNQYGMVLGVQSETELKAMTTSASYVRLYGFDNTNKRVVTDYLYVEGDRTGVIPDDPTATGSWILVATSNSDGGGDDEGKASPPYIPYTYNNGSAIGGETTIPVPAGTVGVPMIVVEGCTNLVGYGFTYDAASLTVTLAQPLEPGDEVHLFLTGTPAVPDNPNVTDWVQINWLYNGGYASGGEQVIPIPYTFESVPAIYKNGERYYAGLVDKSYTVDSANQRILLTEPLATNDRLIITIGGESTTLIMSDRTIQEVARSANVKDTQVILSTNTTQYLNGMKAVYDVVAQKIYGLPALPTNVYINSVSNGQLTYSPGNITVDLLPLPDSATSLEAKLVEEDGVASIGGSTLIVDTFADALLVSNVNSKQLITRSYFSGSAAGGSTYVKDGTTGAPSTGDAAKFFDASGTGWKLVTSTINYAQFGAVLDGVVNDTAAVVKAHTYSLSTGIPIVQVGGVAYVTPDTSTNQVVYNVDADYTGGFYFVTDSVTGRGFVVRDIASEVTLNQSDVTIAEFAVTRMKIPSLASYANYFAVLSSTEQDLNRKRDTGPAPQAKAQGIVLGDGGTLDAPLYTTFSSLSQIKLQSILIPTITISGFCLKTRGGINIANPFGVQRNNVILKNFRYEDLGTSETIPVQSLISVEFCYNVDIDGISSDPLSKGIIDYNYTINTWKSTKIRIRNMSGFDGWAQLDGNYCRDVIVEDSTIDRVGVHFRGYDYTFRNLNSRRGRCIAVTGGGSLVVNNIKVRIDSSISADEQYTAVVVRGDYGAEWDGTISIKDVVMDFTNFYSSTTGLVSGMLSVIVDSTVGAHDFGRTVVMPRSIYVENCTFLINNMLNSRMRAVVVGCTSAITSGIVYPSNITVKNVNAIALSNVKYKIQALHWDTANRGELSRKDINIFLENVVNIDPALYNETVLDDPNSTVYIGTTGTNSRIKFFMVNCPWHSITTSGSYIEGNIHGGGVHYFNSVANTGTRLNFKGVDFYGTRFRGTGKVTIQNSIFRNYIDKDSASVAIGNGQNVDSVVTFIQGTATETGATLTGTAITVALAKTGYAQSGYFQ